MTTEPTMTDACGVAIPTRHVKAYDRLRDRVARRILKRWQTGRSMLERIRQETAADIALVQDAAIDGRDQVELGEKGNFQAMSFDALIQYGRSVRYVIRFDDRLRKAQEIIEGIIAEKALGIDEDVATLIKGVFRPTSNGLLCQARVIGLFRLKIKHARWQQAMDLIRDCMDPQRGKTLFWVRFKPSRDAAWQSVLLDIADACPPAVPNAAQEGGAK